MDRKAAASERQAPAGTVPAMLLLDPTTISDLRPLRAHCAGDVVVPGERVFDDALDVWDLDGVPAAIVFPADELDVATVLSYLRYAGLEPVVEGDVLPDDVDGTVLVHRPGTRGPWVAAW